MTASAGCLLSIQLHLPNAVTLGPLHHMNVSISATQPSKTDIPLRVYFSILLMARLRLSSLFSPPPDPLLTQAVTMEGAYGY